MTITHSSQSGAAALPSSSFLKDLITVSSSVQFEPEYGADSWSGDLARVCLLAYPESVDEELLTVELRLEAVVPFDDVPASTLDVVESVSSLLQFHERPVIAEIARDTLHRLDGPRVRRKDIGSLRFHLYEENRFGAWRPCGQLVTDESGVATISGISCTSKIHIVCDRSIWDQVYGTPAKIVTAINHELSSAPDRRASNPQERPIRFKRETAPHGVSPPVSRIEYSRATIPDMSFILTQADDLSQSVMTVTGAWESGGRFVICRFGCDEWTVPMRIQNNESVGQVTLPRPIHYLSTVSPEFEPTDTVSENPNCQPGTGSDQAASVHLTDSPERAVPGVLAAADDVAVPRELKSVGAEGWTARVATDGDEIQWEFQVSAERFPFGCARVELRIQGEMQEPMRTLVPLRLVDGDSQSRQGTQSVFRRMVVDGFDPECDWACRLVAVDGSNLIRPDEVDDLEMLIDGTDDEELRQRLTELRDAIAE